MKHTDSVDSPTQIYQSGSLNGAESDNTDSIAPSHDSIIKSPKSPSSTSKECNLSQQHYYPSITSTYWLPPSNPTPYLVPGNFVIYY